MDPEVEAADSTFTASSLLETGLKAQAHGSTYSDLLINPKQMTMNFKWVLNFSFHCDQKVNNQTKNGGISVCIPRFPIELLNLYRLG